MAGVAAKMDKTKCSKYTEVLVLSKLKIKFTSLSKYPWEYSLNISELDFWLIFRYLQDNYSFIDRNRTGIWGWSYGGFASTWALVKDTENVFKFALAVAPVTSFIYYGNKPYEDK